MLEGKGVQAVLETWQRKREYQFWTARLRDSFRLAPVRRLAEERLCRFEQFMEELAAQQAGSDVAAVLGASSIREASQTQ
jgi:hypothetical protein